tara:strand:+ start:633 stop:935 length:303 start_codon:yes stop_codon:yes gene_type:complete
MADKYKVLDGVRVKMTAEEIAEKERLEQEYEKNKLSDFDIAIRDLRSTRNFLLAQTDYLALLDQTLTDEMKKYRKDLRDLTNGLTTKAEVDAVTFPTKPE